MGVLDGIHPDFLCQVPDFAFPDRAIIYGPTKITATDGQVTTQYTNVLYDDVPCRRVPSVLTRNMSDEHRREVFTRERVDFGILLKGSYPLVTADCQVKLGDVYYKISPPDIDGNGLMLRLHANDNQPLVE